MTRLDAAIAALRGRFLEGLEARADTLVKLREAMVAGDAEAAVSIRRHAHQVSGTGASYGFAQLSDAGRNTENAATEDLPAQLDALLDVMRALVAEHRAKPTPPESPR